MKMVISPAKSLNFESNLPTEQNSNPCFLAEADRINHLLKEKTPAEISQLMKISEKLGNLNWERNQNFKLPFNKHNARPAVYTFDGDVYTGLDVFTLPPEKIQVLQESLRILSGLYGVLKPASIPEAVLIIAKYMKDISIVPDQEVNMLACLTEIMMSCEFK